MQEVNILQKIEEGFSHLQVSNFYKIAAIKNIQRWLTKEEFKDYKEQILYLIENKKFELLLDSFYQVIPFGTGGRRGPVGIGTNRINTWTLQASAQGHSNYLLKKYPDAKERGVVIAYDCRKYPETTVYNPNLPNPVKGMTSKDFAEAAAAVYTANELLVYIFEDIRTTPELSFAVPHLNAVAGIVISASHNPKEDNGKKIYGADGSQLIPPEDQVVAETVNAVETINREANANLIRKIGKEIDDAYIAAVRNAAQITKQINNKSIKILYTPLHGVGSTSIFKALTEAGFSVIEDNATKTPDGFFTNVKFNIPNPEVPESFETCYTNPEAALCDIIFASDPDADRLGVAAKHNGKWKYLNGNEIGIILLAALVAKEQNAADKIVAKTAVTSSLLTKMCEKNEISIINDLLVGFKYVGNEIAQLEKQEKEKNFLLGLEESHGYLVGTYCRDKDAAAAALVLAELAEKLKPQNKTIVKFLDDIYKEYGYAENYLASLIMQGAAGIEKITMIQNEFRAKKPKKIGEFFVKGFTDKWDGGKHLSETDTASRNVLVFELDPVENVESMKITVRPSGTEPKTKIYMEVVAKPLGKEASDEQLEKEKQICKEIRNKIKNAFLKEAYNILNIEMPERGYLLSDLLSVETKTKYFAVEKNLLETKMKYDKKEITLQEYEERISSTLKIFGKDPVEKINACFEVEHKTSFKEYFQLS
ncbi:phospho-sugar mutase [Candidatus Woesearchaeota archaeon]|nr:phospho-sugar mutase [Candidatus Woesearchaeota archaeon]